MRKKLTFITWTIFRKGTESKTSPEEQQKLEKWLAANESNKSYFIKAVRHYQTLGQEDPEVKKPSEAYQEFIIKTSHRKRLNLKRIASAAAVVVLLISGTALIHQVTKRFDTMDLQYSSTHIQAPIYSHPGQVELVLSSGQSVILDKVNQRSIKEKSGEIKKDDKAIDYLDFDNTASTELVYNTVKVPRGTDFKVILSDSTVVWLNAESTITYPTQFASHFRKVEVTGEAYFEVHKDSSRPFVVDINRSSIEVLGTHFNVNSHNSEAGVITTLLEGSVRVENAFNETRIIKPNEQAITNNTPSITVKQVNTDLVVDWRKGLFLFEDERLEIILSKLSRWYDFDIFYESQDLKDYQFTGTLDRDHDMNKILNIIEKTQAVSFQIKDRALLVKMPQNKK